MSQSNPQPTDIFDVHKPEDVKRIVIDPTYQLPDLYIIFVCHDKTIYGSMINQHRFDKVNAINSPWYQLIFKSEIIPGFMTDNLPTLTKTHS